MHVLFFIQVQGPHSDESLTCLTIIDTLVYFHSGDDQLATGDHMVAVVDVWGYLKGSCIVTYLNWFLAGSSWNNRNKSLVGNRLVSFLDWRWKMSFLFFDDEVACNCKWWRCHLAPGTEKHKSTAWCLGQRWMYRTYAEINLDLYNLCMPMTSIG